MFIRLEDNIININEIRNVTMDSIGYGKGVVKIIFRTCQDPLIFTSRPLAECRALINALTEACVTKNN